MRTSARTPAVDIRTGEEDDIPLLLSFIHEMGEFEKLEVSATEKSLKESLFGTHPAAEVLLAFADDRPAAYAVYFFTFASMAGRRGLWLDDLYVKPEFRRRGIATALVQDALEWALDRGCREADLNVLFNNEKARHLYQKLGFSVFQYQLRIKLSAKVQAGSAGGGELKIED